MATEETELSFIRCPNCRSLVPGVATRCRMCGQPLEGSKASDAGSTAGGPSRSRVRQRTMSVSAEEVAELTEHLENRAGHVAESEAARFDARASQRSSFNQQPKSDLVQDEEPGAEESKPESAPAVPYREPEALPRPPRRDFGWTGLGKESVAAEPVEETPAIKNFEIDEPLDEKPPQRADHWDRRETQAESVHEAAPTAPPELELTAEVEENSDGADEEFEEEIEQDDAEQGGPNDAAAFGDGSRRRRRRRRRRHKGPLGVIVGNQGASTTMTPAQPQYLPQSAAEPKNVHETARPGHVPSAEGMIVGWLVTYAESAKGSSSELRAGKFFISRDKLRPNDLVLQNDTVSSPHCMICAEAESVRLLDLLSERGTFVRRRGASEFEKVSGEVELHHGDSVRFGECEMLLCLIPR